MQGRTQIWTEEQKQYVFNNYKKLKKKQILEELNKNGITHSEGSLKAFYTKYKLVSGLDCKFPKGHTPWTKGRKISPEVYEKIKANFFTTGQAPHNKQPVNTEVINSYGYVKVKIGEPDIWEFKHRLIWEKERGKVPEGYRITFLDGDRTNCNIDNLCLITSGEDLTLNKEFKEFSTPEERQVQIDIVKLNKKIRMKEK